KSMASLRQKVVAGQQAGDSGAFRSTQRRVPYLEYENDARRLAVIPGAVLVAVVEDHQPAEPRLARFAAHLHAAAGGDDQRQVDGQPMVGVAEMRRNPRARLEDRQERLVGRASQGHQRQPLERGAHLWKAGKRALIRQRVVPEMKGAPVRTSREAAPGLAHLMLPDVRQTVGI